MVQITKAEMLLGKLRPLIFHNMDIIYASEMYDLFIDRILHDRFKAQPQASLQHHSDNRGRNY